MIEVEVKGLREALNTLARFDKELVRELRLDLAQVAGPLTTAIRSNIPTYPPIRGFKHGGRTAWPTSPVKIKTKLNTSRSRRGMQKALVVISVENAGVEIADMAGRKNKVRTSGVSRSYVKGSVIMDHRLSGQGKSMIEALSQTGRGKASRYIYSAVEKYEKTITMEIEKTIALAIIKGNQRLQQKAA
jgi:hypothetical protein